MKQRSGPGYIEAYPRFNVVQANAACDRGKDVCHFYNDRGLHLGILFVGESTASSITLEFSVGYKYFPHAFGRAILPIEPVQNRVNPNHLVMRCPGCGSRKSALSFKGLWRCSGCHGLLYRSQLVDKHTRKRERLGILKKQVGRHKPHGMHRTTYHRLVTELRKLTGELGRTLPAYPSEDHSHRIRSEWRTLEDSLEALTLFIEYRICDGKLEVNPNHPGYRDFTE